MKFLSPLRGWSGPLSSNVRGGAVTYYLFTYEVPESSKRLVRTFVFKCPGGGGGGVTYCLITYEVPESSKRLIRTFVFKCPGGGGVV